MKENPLFGGVADADHFNLQRQRDQLLALHRELMQRARDAMHKSAPAPVVDYGELEAALLDAQKVIERQRQRIDELGELHTAYKSLKLQYEILEQTNAQLLEQVLAFDEQLAQKQQLEQLLDVQRDSLETMRRRLREMEARYERAVNNLKQVQRDYRELEKGFQAYRDKVKRLFDDLQTLHRENDHLKQVLRQQELSHMELIRQYERVRAEYEAMFGNLPDPH